MAQTIFGFDSAWTDNPKAPGALCALRLTRDSVFFAAPELATFSRAAELINAAKSSGDYVLVALDQPTIVPNASGGRPVEKVAASVISAIGGGVQPSSKARLGMFDEDAPVWRFLGSVDCAEDPVGARRAATGAHLVEVFPALALASLIPLTWSRRAGAKYNPGNKNFKLDDWVLVCQSIAILFSGYGIAAAAAWCESAGELAKPRKADQDKLDALICLAVALLYRFGGASLDILMLGDIDRGYMITPATKSVAERLTNSARARGVSSNILTDPAPLTSELKLPRTLEAAKAGAQAVGTRRHLTPATSAPARRNKATPVRSTARAIASGSTTVPGYLNRNNQKVLRRTDLPGNDHNQVIYVLECGGCSFQYGVNGSDIFQRKCPRCQGGVPGLTY